MGWTFKAHGALAYALGITLLALTALALLPTTTPPIRPTGPGWPTMAILALVIPTVLSALVRAYFVRADHRTAWLAFRCLPEKVQLALAAAFLVGIALLALNLTTGAGNDNPHWLAVPALLYITSAYAILATGEMKRADREIGEA
ncbi:hypothetical protein GTW40_31815 [Streptomyces sp. SID4985]|uniref:hypothetical protein n=1 Tax=Streptomyces sp. SID4985 TaxID=2690292 RepID=UPI00136C5D9D|nr:hypothetical protein [Streptomyces sp. SID4985]MYQ49554.1 hypothetical protein [Streptomyces sp. SID4985]